MKINFEKQGDRKIFHLEGRLDTNTSPQLHEKLIPEIDGSGAIVLDFAGLEYVSSAGLRVLLTAQKKCMASGTEMTITGVIDEIMEVFEMTGFADILTIE